MLKKLVTVLSSVLLLSTDKLSSAGIYFMLSSVDDFQLCLCLVLSYFLDKEETVVF